MDAKSFGQLLKDYPKMLEDRSYCKAILQDIYPAERGAVNLIVTAHKAGAARILRGSDSRSVQMSRLVNLLMDDYSIAEERARWAAALWAEAYESSLGLVRQKEPAVLKESDASWFLIYKTGGDCEIIKYVGPNVEQIVIPKGITKIKYFSFACCSNLTSVVIQKGVTEIGGHAFSGCGRLTSIVIPDSVTEIGEGAFYHCSNLTSIIIPDSVTKIGTGAFAGCIGLNIVIPDSVSEIGEKAFDNCPDLTIHARAGSEAERYATENHLPFHPIG